MGAGGHGGPTTLCCGLNGSILVWSLYDLKPWMVICSHCQRHLRSGTRRRPFTCLMCMATQTATSAMAHKARPSTSPFTLLVVQSTVRERVFRCVNARDETTLRVRRSCDVRCEDLRSIAQSLFRKLPLRQSGYFSSCALNAITLDPCSFELNCHCDSEEWADFPNILRRFARTYLIALLPGIPDKAVSS